MAAFILNSIYHVYNQSQIGWLDSLSRSHDRAVALSRLEKAGAVLTTSEAAIFDLMRTAEHPKFKDVSKLVKVSCQDAAFNQFAQDTTM